MNSARLVPLKRIVLLVLTAIAIAACDRVVDLTPAPDAFGPDGAIGADAGNDGPADAGFTGDGQTGDGGGASFDAGGPDA